MLPPVPLVQTTENQKRELREIADGMGWIIVEVYGDNGVRARSFEPSGQRWTRCVRTLRDVGSTWSWHGPWTI